MQKFNIKRTISVTYILAYTTMAFYFASTIKAIISQTIDTISTISVYDNVMKPSNNRLASD